MRLSNIARSLSEIAPQASLFIPMTLPTAKLPPYVTIDPQSPWHVSGLLSAALESMSLPSRLKMTNGSRQTMDRLISALNINGSQNIAKLRMSVDQTAAPNGHHRPGRLDAPAESRDPRLRSQDRSDQNLPADGESALTTFDMDFFPVETGEQTRRRSSNKEPHVFGQAEGYRVPELPGSQEATEEDEGYDRARRRAAGLPLIQRLVKISSFGDLCRGKYLVLSYRGFHHTISGFLCMYGLLPTGFLLTITAGPLHPCCFPCLTAFPTSSHMPA